MKRLILIIVLIAAGVSVAYYFLGMNGTVRPDVDVVEVVTRHIVKRGVHESDISVQVTEDRGTYVRGNVTMVSAQGTFFAKVIGGEYEVVYAGGGPFSCSLLEQYGFPEDMQEGCKE